MGTMILIVLIQIEEVQVVVGLVVSPHTVVIMVQVEGTLHTIIHSIMYN